MDEPRDPSLEDVLERFREVALEGLRVCLPGQITAYDATRQLASVQPLVQDRFLAEDGETLITRTLPVVHSCPVHFLGPARGRITWPVAAGDTCLILFASSSIRRWVRIGGVVDPGDDRHHDIDDAIVLVGLHDAAHVPTTAPTDAVTVHVSGSTQVRLGGPSAAQSVLRGEAYLSALGTLLDAIATAVGGIPGGAAAGTAIQTAITAFEVAASNYKSTRVKVE